MTDYKELPKPFFILAPMDDVTDIVFRKVITKTAKPDMFFTEFVNADGLQSPGRSNLLRKLKFDQSETSLVAQIWGKNPDNFYKTAEQIADGSLAKELGLPEGCNFIGVDLNMGCPQKSEVNGGTCAALINNRPLALEIINATKQGLAGRLPLSIKTRLGYNEIDLSWPKLLLEQNLNMLTIHGRTKREMSKVPAHWSYINEVRKLRDKINPDTLIVGNGDVIDRAHGLELAKQYKLDGIMIGRGIFNDPFAFSESSPWGDYSKEQRVNLFKEHVSLFSSTWSNSERPIHVLNKFCKVYISDFDGAKEVRERLMNCNSIDSLVQELSILS
jgi:tRNA-dihydrouridine synthase